MSPNVQPPRGMRDLGPGAKRHREEVLAQLRAGYRAWGFDEIETPALEEIGRLSAGDSGDNTKLMYRVLKRGLDESVPVLPSEAVDLGLRYDLTVPLARFYATHRSELPGIFRSLQMGSVWRAERPQKGRFRQFTQCDIDVIGDPTALAEIQLVCATLDALRRVGLAEVGVRMNDRALLDALLDWAGFAPEQRSSALITIDKLDKIGLAGVADELAARGAGAAGLQLLGVLEKVVDQVAQGPEDLDGVLSQLPAGVAEQAQTLAEVRRGVRTAFGDVQLVVDPTLVRGQGYYTGPIFELTHAGSSSSVGGGGRYDNMIGQLSGTDVPACGFSIGFERIIDLASDEEYVRSPVVGLLYDRTLAPSVVVAWQRALVIHGYAVRLAARSAKLGRDLAALEAQGAEAYLSLDADREPPRPGEKLAPQLVELRGEE